MCTNQSVAAPVDVAALLAAAPGVEVMTALTGLDLAALSESERLVVLEVWERQQHWVWAQTMTATASFVGQQPVDSDDFVREDVRAALRQDLRGEIAKRMRRGAAEEGDDRDALVAQLDAGHRAEDVPRGGDHVVVAGHVAAVVERDRASRAGPFAGALRAQPARGLQRAVPVRRGVRAGPVRRGARAADIFSAGRNAVGHSSNREHRTIGAN